MGSPFGGSNFQSNLGGVGVPGNINNAFNQSYGLASNLGGVGAPGSKNPLKLQNLQPAYAGIRDWTRGNIVGETPQMMGMGQNASQMGMSSADLITGISPALQR